MHDTTTPGTLIGDLSGTAWPMGEEPIHSPSAVASITLRLYGIEAEIRLENAPVEINEVIEGLVKPVLLAVGFLEKTVDEALGLVEPPSDPPVFGESGDTGT